MANTPQKKFARLGGSAVTQFKWDGEVIAFARQVSVQSPTPVGPGTVPIHPLNRRRPVELITPLAATMGAMQIELYELFGQKTWERLTFLGGSINNGSASRPYLMDIVDIFLKVADRQPNKPIQVVKVIKPRGRRGATLTEHFHNVVVSQVEDGETIEIGTMEVLKRMTLNFTHSTFSKS